MAKLGYQYKSKQQSSVIVKNNVTILLRFKLSLFSGMIWRRKQMPCHLISGLTVLVCMTLDEFSMNKSFRGAHGMHA